MCQGLGQALGPALGPTLICVAPRIGVGLGGVTVGGDCVWPHVSACDCVRLLASARPSVVAKIDKAYFHNINFFLSRSRGSGYVDFYGIYCYLFLHVQFLFEGQAFASSFLSLPCPAFRVVCPEQSRVCLLTENANFLKIFTFLVLFLSRGVNAMFGLVVG